MKRTEVDADGTVRCPRCGATSFRPSRKYGIYRYFPKSHCNGCGAHLKPGKPPSKKDRKIRQTAATQPTTQPLAGWYPDQQNPAMVRWFDGQQWTDHLQARQESTR